MTVQRCEQAIAHLFHDTVNKDKALQNAYLRVYSPSMGLQVDLAAGHAQDSKLHPQQPNYWASVGKLFTATLVAMLVEEERLSFDDPIAAYLDAELVEGLHRYRGVDYSQRIQIRQLLNQTSGLPDNFWPLMQRVLQEPDFTISPRQAIQWTKSHALPKCAPGAGFQYTDTNYHLLGLIVEAVTGLPFHAVLQQRLFAPLGMQHSWMLHYSQPAQPSPYPMAGFFLEHTRLNDHQGYAGLDYAGGGVVGPSNDLLRFMQALVNHRLVSRATLERMKSDKARFGLGIDYGYGIWQFKAIPLLLPRKLQCWGVVGASGAFLFYHPALDAYLIGNFNDARYQSKGVRFMLKAVNLLNKQRPVPARPEARESA